MSTNNLTDAKDEIGKAFRLADSAYYPDMADADKIKSEAKRKARQSEIQANYYTLKALYWKAKTADLSRIGAAVQGALRAAIKARSDIENATAADKDLIARIGKFSLLASAAADLFEKAQKEG